MAVEKMNVCGAAAGDYHREGPPVLRAAMVGPAEAERPPWVTEVMELIRAVSLQQSHRPRPGPRVC